MDDLIDDEGAEHLSAAELAKMRRQMREAELAAARDAEPNPEELEAYIKQRFAGRGCAAAGSCVCASMRACGWVSSWKPASGSAVRGAGARPWRRLLSARQHAVRAAGQPGMASPQLRTPRRCRVARHALPPDHPAPPPPPPFGWLRAAAATRRGTRRTTRGCRAARWGSRR